MRYLTLGILLLSFRVAMAQTPPSYTARFVSSGIILGIKDGAKRDRTSSDRQIRCVVGIQNAAIASTLQEIIDSSLSEQEISVLEKFYSSRLGIRYTDSLIAGKNVRDVFTASEISELEMSLRQIPFKKLAQVTSSSSPGVASKIKAALKPLLQQCYGEA